jgi:hypothetical protein
MSSIFSNTVFAGIERGIPETIINPVAIDGVHKRARALSRGDTVRTTTCDDSSVETLVGTREGAARSFFVEESAEASSPESIETGDGGVGLIENSSASGASSPRTDWTCMSISFIACRREPETTNSFFASSIDADAW